MSTSDGCLAMGNEAIEELFVLAAQRWTVLLQKPWAAGLVYGAILYAAMTHVIVPHLSAAQGWKTAEDFWSNLRGAMGHGFFVGVPIACVARHFLSGYQAAGVNTALSGVSLGKNLGSSPAQG